MVPFAQANLTRINSWTHHWFWRFVIIPFVLIRIVLLAAVLIAPIFPTSTVYSKAVLQRGWEYHPNPLLDVWAHWDARWYLSIIKDGYSLRGEVTSVTSNIAFFPLYPYLVKALAFPFDPDFSRTGILLLVGILVSNAFFLAALYLLYKLIRLVFPDEDVAARAVLYLLLFPTGFFFSAFYTESTFLFFAVASFYAAKKEKWMLAGLMAALATLTRPTGVVLAAPLLWLYGESIGWKPGKIRLNVVWIGLAPLALLGFMRAIASITGDLFSIFKIQAAWEKSFNMPWNTILHPAWPTPIITPIDQVAAVLFIILSIIALFRLPSLSYGLLSILMLAPSLFSGQILSITRYCSVIFPCFILLAIFGKNQNVDKITRIVFFTIQVIFMIAWTRFYWVQ